MVNNTLAQQETQMFTITPGYGLPIFADGTVRFTVNKGDVSAFQVVHPVRGTTGAEQNAEIEAGRTKLQEFVDLANVGLKVAG
jgi:hypothetical protein